MAQADYLNAVERYRQASDLDPAAVGPHFGLGSAYSFLDKRAEAIAQFRWVLSHASSDSTEYQQARRWLEQVGAGTLVKPAKTDSGTTSPAGTADPSSSGRLVGTTEWPGVTPKTHIVRGTMSLVGDEPVTQDVKRSRAFRLGDAYEFKGLPAGRYRVVAVVGEATVWDEKVTVEPGKDTTLQLTQPTSRMPASAFSPPVSASSGDASRDASRQ